MPLFGHHNTQNDTVANTEANSGRGPAVGSNQPMHAGGDPLYNNDRGLNQENATQGGLAGYHVPGGTAGPQATSGAYQDGGMGMGQGHQNSAIPQGGMTQGTGVAPGPMDRNLATNQNNHAVGSGNGMGMGGGTGGGGGMGGGMGGGGGMQQANLPDLADAKKLERSGKLDKFIGSVTHNTLLKQEGLEKQADAAAIREQTRHLTEAQRLEQEAQMRRGAAVGMGAHPGHMHAGAPGQLNSGVQPSYGTGTGAPVGGGMGGGAYGGLR